MITHCNFIVLIFNNNDIFSLCVLLNIKMHALLKERGILAPFSGLLTKIDKSILEQQEEKAYFLILLSLSDEVLYEVSEEKIVSALCSSWRNFS